MKEVALQISSFTHAGQEQRRSKSHILTGSEPEVLLGSDSGPNAVELVLAALGFCYSVGFVYNAAALGCELEEISYEVEGDLDLRNFGGIDAGPRPGSTRCASKAMPAPRTPPRRISTSSASTSRTPRRLRTS
jgi:uncharacterized OsmC-like protein